MSRLIVHLCTYDSGGAANACYRLHLSLIERGWDSKMLVLHKSKNDVNVVQYQVPLKERIVRKVNWTFKKSERPKGDYEVFSTPSSPYQVEKHPLVLRADIIHLHWVSGFVDYERFFSMTNKHIVWTLHDKNPFSGWSHYAIDTKKNPDLHLLEDEFIHEKTKHLKNSSIDFVICPSKWIETESKASLPFGHFHHVNIPYGVDETIFRPLLEDSPKEPNQGKPPWEMLIIADGLNNSRKGMHLVEYLISEIVDMGIELVVAGSIDESRKSPYVNYLGRIDDVHRLSEIYASAAFTIVPSLEDNLPNVVLESMASGTPVIAFDIGGMPDMIADGVDGILCKQMDSPGLLRGIERSIQLLKNGGYGTMSAQSREKVEKCFYFDNQARRVSELYETVLSKEKG